MKKYLLFICLLCIPFIGIVKAENGPFRAFADISINYGEGYIYVYNPREDTDEHENASYDVETNTLTLDNITCKRIEVSSMGEDFKIKLIGNNTINSGIKIEGENYKTNLEIIGTGSLVLGADNLWTEAISITYGNLVIDNTVELIIQNQSNSDKNLISVYNDSSEDKLITIKSDEEIEVISESSITDPYYYYGAYLNPVINNGYIIKKGTKYYAAELMSGTFFKVYNRELQVLEYNDETIYYIDFLLTSEYTEMNIELNGYEIVKSNTDILEASTISGRKKIDSVSNKIYYVDNEVYEITDKTILWNNLEYKFVIIKNDINEDNLEYVDNLKLSYIDSHYLEISPSEYVIIDGNNSTYDSKNPLDFKINARYSLFKDGGKVYVDDKEITDYTSKEGSTIITLNTSFLDTLEPGRHNIKVEFTNGAYAAGEFTINEKKNNPKTGDSIISIISILVISLLVLIINKRHQMIQHI
ncbi:MAG: hypothetical protein IJS56_06280 [Bacilli bacterium]|nr:hypothetical protein [Bacilli bacterium]